MKNDICTCPFTATCSPGFPLVHTCGSLSPICYPLLKVQTSVHAAIPKMGKGSRKRRESSYLRSEPVWEMLPLLMVQGWPSPGREEKKGGKKRRKPEKRGEGLRQVWNHKEMEIWNIEEEEEKGKKETTEKWSYLLNWEYEYGSPTRCVSAFTSEHLWSMCRSYFNMGGIPFKGMHLKDWAQDQKGISFSTSCLDAPEQAI